MIFCPKCGDAIPNDSVTCPMCGENLKKENEGLAVVYASQTSSDTLEASSSQIKGKIPKQAIIAICAVVAVIFVIFISSLIGRSSLKKALMRPWLATENSIIKVLEFSDSEVEYRLETGYRWMDTSLGTYKYKVVGKNKIKIKMYSDDYETYTIEFNDDKDIMTVTPAITSSDRSEIWVYLEDYN